MTGSCQHCGKQTERWGLWDGFDKATGKATHGTFFDCGCTDPTPTPIGDAIRQRRRACALSLRDLNERTSIPPVQLSHFEQGRETPNAAQVFVIAAALDADYEDLMVKLKEGAT